MENAIPKVLIISSTVASSRIGATAAAFCLRRLGVEAVVLPTTLMGRHPGWGAPGGGAVETARLRDIWAGVKAQNIRFDAVLTGYMGETAHVRLATEIIADVKATNPNAKIWVDPVMGDGTPESGRLYIPAERAEAIRDELVPLADCITPNLWELGWLHGRPCTTFDEIRAAILDPMQKTLVTSVLHNSLIGAVWILGDLALYCGHTRFDSVPHGGGDALGAILLAHDLSGLEADTTLKRAVGAIFDIMHAADATDAGELPLVRCQDALINPQRLAIETLI